MTPDQSVIALDPATGKPRATFGTDGSVDSRDGLDRDPATLSANPTSPGVVYHDLLIVGFRAGETHPAAIRACDVHTGAFRPGAQAGPARQRNLAGGGYGPAWRRH